MYMIAQNNLKNEISKMAKDSTLIISFSRNAFCSRQKQLPSPAISRWVRVNGWVAMLSFKIPPLSWQPITVQRRILSCNECSRIISKNSDKFQNPLKKNCRVEEKGTGWKWTKKYFWETCSQIKLLHVNYCTFCNLNSAKNFNLLPMWPNMGKQNVLTRLK